jgi:hypothetical protein
VAPSTKALQELKLLAWSVLPIRHISCRALTEETSPRGDRLQAVSLGKSRAYLSSKAKIQAFLRQEMETPAELWVGSTSSMLRIRTTPAQLWQILFLAV